MEHGKPAWHVSQLQKHAPNPHAVKMRLRILRTFVSPQNICLLATRSMAARTDRNVCPTLPTLPARFCALVQVAHIRRERYHACSIQSEWMKTQIKSFAAAVAVALSTAQAAQWNSVAKKNGSTRPLSEASPPPVQLAPRAQTNAPEPPEVRESANFAQRPETPQKMEPPPIAEPPPSPPQDNEPEPPNVRQPENQSEYFTTEPSPEPQQAKEPPPLFEHSPRPPHPQTEEPKPPSEPPSVRKSEPPPPKPRQIPPLPAILPRIEQPAPQPQKLPPPSTSPTRTPPGLATSPTLPPPPILPPPPKLPPLELRHPDDEAPELPPLELRLLDGEPESPPDVSAQ